MNLVALPAFSDNYIWMLHDGQEALVVDPGAEAPVLGALAERHLSLTGILVTHHHADHVGGLSGLRSILKGPVYGPATENIPQPFTPVAGGDQVRWHGMVFDVLDVPGHTAGHVAYVAPGVGDGEPARLFCGDTLFSGGCGRLFEGTPGQMLASLQTLADLPGATQVCCAHEYTLSNLRFALAAEPGNAALTAYIAHCETLRQQGRPTLPSTVGLELQINPFLRCSEPALVSSALKRGAMSTDPVQVFATLREWKNIF